MTMMSKPFIGLTGTNASGKGMVGSYLKQFGYTYISLSDILRDIAKRSNLPPDREHLTQIGQDQRKKLGPGFLAKHVLSNINLNRFYLIDSIRHPEEVNVLRAALPSFELWSIDAKPSIRFERAKKRGRSENASSLDAFIQRENLEKGSEPHHQQLHLAMNMADHTILNNTTLNIFYAQINELVDQIT